jgi:hypothetical protein
LASGNSFDFYRKHSPGIFIGIIDPIIWKLNMNPQVHDIALATGGSHWPTVGGRLLEQSILAAVRQCIAIAVANDDSVTAQDIAQHFGIETTQ